MSPVYMGYSDSAALYYDISRLIKKLKVGIDTGARQFI